MTFGEKIGHLVMKYLVVPKSPIVQPGKKKIACIGDSITFGAGVRGKYEKTWEYTLQQKLGDDYQVLNYGISGRTLLKSGDYPYTDEKFYSITKELLADIYIIMLGTNDSKPYNWKEAAYEKELEDFIKEYNSLNNQPKVLLMTPPACYEDPKLGMVGYDINGDIIHTKIYETVIKIAEKLNLEYIDLHRFTVNHNEWFDDGVHPNAGGNRCIGEFIYEQIKEICH